MVRFVMPTTAAGVFNVIIKKVMRSKSAGQCVHNRQVYYTCIVHLYRLLCHTSVPMFCYMSDFLLSFAIMLVDI